MLGSPLTRSAATGRRDRVTAGAQDGPETRGPGAGCRVVRGRPGGRARGRRTAAPESYTNEFQRLRARAGLPRIKLHGLRNTSVSLMLDQGHPPHIVAAWHGHDPAVTLSIYSDVKADELRAVGASLFR